MSNILTRVPERCRRVCDYYWQCVVCPHEEIVCSHHDPQRPLPCPRCGSDMEIFHGHRVETIDPSQILVRCVCGAHVLCNPDRPTPCSQCWRSYFPDGRLANPNPVALGRLQETS